MTRNSQGRESATKPYRPIPWSIADIVEALNLSEESVPLELQGMCEPTRPCFSGISTDSRAINKDELFVALRGESFDGHTFLFDLIKKELKGFVVDETFFNALTREEKQDISNRNVILFPVGNTLEALGQLAGFQRLRSGVKVVAITGSNGKTTTRKMTSSIFEQQFHTLSTSGNFNNEIGLPLTLLKLSGQHEWAVVEMGMNHPGEISRLSQIARPDIAVITNTADAHLEGMGTVHNVAKAKAEITEGMNPDSTLIVNRNDPRRDIIVQIAATAAQQNRIAKLLYFDALPEDESGIFPGPQGEDAQTKQEDREEQEQGHVPRGDMKLFQTRQVLTAKNIEFHNRGIGFNLSFNESDDCSDNGTEDCSEPFSIHSPAPFMIHNALAACAAAFSAGISAHKIQKGLSLFKPVSGRMNIVEKNNIRLIDDTYNANPASVKGALATLKQLRGEGVAIAVLGDMLELGERSRELHFSVGESAAHAGISMLYAFGPMATEVIRGAVQAGLPEEQTLHGTKSEIIAHLAEYLETHASTRIHLLIKGSRGMKMEEIVQTVTEQE